MKKKTIFLIGMIVLAVVVVIALLVGGMLLVKQMVKGSVNALNQVNVPSRMLTAEEFKEKMEQRGLLLTDPQEEQTEQEINYTYMDQVYVASSEDAKYQIKFYECKDEVYAKAFYMNIKDRMEKAKKNVYTQRNVDLSNRAKYELNSSGNYMVVSRIGNTVLQANVKPEYKEEIQKILEEIQY